MNFIFLVPEAVVQLHIIYFLVRIPVAFIFTKFGIFLLFFLCNKANGLFFDSHFPGFLVQLCITTYRAYFSTVVSFSPPCLP